LLLLAAASAGVGALWWAFGRRRFPHQAPAPKPREEPPAGPLPDRIGIRVDGLGETIEYTFAKSVVKIGRLRSSDVLLPADEVARMHAVIELAPTFVRIIDLGAASGTFVNDRPVDKNASLHSGDKVRIGPYTLTVTWSLPQAERDPAEEAS
jgi:pSer/pThr/pTyr-binding forkhead associated (FHA) protein